MTWSRDSMPPSRPPSMTIKPPECRRSVRTGETIVVCSLGERVAVSPACRILALAPSHQLGQGRRLDKNAAGDWWWRRRAPRIALRFPGGFHRRGRAARTAHASGVQPAVDCVSADAEGIGDRGNGNPGFSERDRPRRFGAVMAIAHPQRAGARSFSARSQLEAIAAAPCGASAVPGPTRILPAPESAMRSARPLRVADGAFSRSAIAAAALSGVSKARLAAMAGLAAAALASKILPQRTRWARA